MSVRYLGYIISDLRRNDFTELTFSLCLLLTWVAVIVLKIVGGAFLHHDLLIIEYIVMCEAVPCTRSALGCGSCPQVAVVLT